MKPLSRIMAFGVLGLAVFADQPAVAQYPERPVRIVVPFGAGGVADITARVVAEKLGDRLGQRFIIDNQPGAGGITAARSVLSAVADGHTLALLTNGTAVSVPLFKALPFDPVKDFSPVSALGFFDFLIATKADGEFHTLADLVQAARAQPGKLNAGTINVGSTQNLSAELLKIAAGVDVAIVPFRGTPEALIALLRGDVQFVIDSYAAMKSQLDGKQIVAVATTGPKRFPLLPDVPTAQEAGVSNFDVTSWNGLFARTGTPEPIIATLNAALRDVLASADVTQRLLELGIEARATTPEELRTRLVGDIDKWGRVIERAGVPKQ